jgi:signal transduction histidine kinase
VRWNNALQGAAEVPSTLVRQVLMNLLLNAIQAAPPGGLVGCTVRTVHDRLSLEVVNDGRYFSPAQLERLFEPFANTTGTGLGLWVVYQIVQQLGGEIRVANGPPATRLEIDLPLGGMA